MAGIGEGFALLSAFGFAAASTTVAKSAGKGPRGDNGAFLSVIMSTASAFAIWLLLRDPAGPLLPAQNALPGIAWFALSGILTIMLGRALLFKSIEYLGAIRASAIKRLNPFFSVLLAAFVLGESISLLAGAGTALIVISLLVLIRRSMAQAQVKTAGRAGATPMAYLFGPLSALAYSFGYVARKFGLFYVPDSNFGTFVGAAAALLSYALGALIWDKYRRDFTGVFRNVTRWQFLAAAFISVGQLSQFAALYYIDLSRAVMIGSLEIFIAMFLAVYVMRTERRPEPIILIAAVMATFGALLVGLG
jgi:drug/metabolite transporter (DMT)-like permease